MTSLASNPARAAGASYPWLLIGMLWLVAFLNSADRSILIAVMPQLRQEFGLTATQLALLNSVFFWIYALTAFLAGRLGDSARRTRVIIYGLLFWSAATGMTSLSTSFAMLLAFRGLVAFGEAFYYPTATALISDWHRPAMRSRALSLHQTAVFAGAGLGAVAAGLLADWIGWHAPFLIFSVIGLIYAFFLFRWLKDAPIVHTAVEKDKPREPIGIVLRIKPALMLCAVFFLANGASTGVTVWAPTYIHDALGLDLAGSALWGSATINLAGFLSVPLGGLLADTLARRTPIGRFYTLAIGLTGAALLLLPLLSASTALTVGIVLLATSVGKGLFDGCIYASMHDVVPPGARATAVGMMTLCGFIGAGLTPIFVAMAAESFGMAAGMTSLAGLYVVAVLLLLATRGSTRAAVLANAHEVAER
ncbi:MFS transporter [Sphingosinicella sp. LHD-64]|uniref:MFS transporter n=1 Tax=Sphingosinicella sp. LHD-64 TaxID=3072139 RepID=UPI00280F0884|nr:MFS transporter [Sphingosinicella sp. LHD-64]MDQ8757111.1 MFS transporter [Sphingosinicella sp. LHD-64]